MRARLETAEVGTGVVTDLLGLESAGSALRISIRFDFLFRGSGLGFVGGGLNIAG